MKISLKLNSIFIYGRYKKLKRGFPQAKWLCGLCKGHGCASCQWTGKLYPESVAELISKPILQATKGSDVKIHAAGREDIDVRVLGSGRPFIIEVLDPINRAIDVPSLEKEINTSSKGKIEVKGLKLTSKNAVSKLKSISRDVKVYRTLVEFERRISEDALFRLTENVKDTIIQQQTPTRVMHRRANRLRRRRIFNIEVKRISSNLVEMIITCEGGLYIKEFISGDSGRTTLSVSEVTQIPAKSIELDVMNILMEDIC